MAESPRALLDPDPGIFEPASDKFFVDGGPGDWAIPLSAVETTFVMPEDPRETFAREAKLADRPGLFRSAFRVEGIFSAVLRSLERGDIADDPNFPGAFNLPDEIQEELFAGIPRYHRKVFHEANSIEQARVIAEQTRQIIEAEDVLAGAGFTGFMARLGAAIFDPPAIAVSAVTGSMIGHVAKGPRIFRLARLASGRSRRALVATGTLISGVENAAIEAFIANDNPTRRVEDILFAGAGAMMLGSGSTILGTRALGRLRPIAARVQQGIRANDLEAVARELGGNVTDAGRRLAGGTPVERGRRVVDQMIKDLDLPDDMLADLKRAADAGDLDLIYGQAVSSYNPRGFPLKVGMTLQEVEDLVSRKGVHGGATRVITSLQRASETSAARATTSPLTRMTNAEFGEALQRSEFFLHGTSAENAQAADLLGGLEVGGLTRDLGEAESFAGKEGVILVFRAEDIPAHIRGIGRSEQFATPEIAREIDLGGDFAMREINVIDQPLKPVDAFRVGEKFPRVVGEPTTTLGPSIAIGDEVTVEFGSTSGKTGKLVGATEDGVYIVEIDGKPTAVMPWEISQQGRILGAPEVSEGGAGRVADMEKGAASEQGELFESIQAAKGRKPPNLPPRQALGQGDFNAWEQSTDLAARDDIIGLGVISMMGQVGRSASKLVRQFASILANQAVPTGAKMPDTMSEAAHRLSSVDLAAMIGVVRPAAERWKKARGRKGGRYNHAAEDEYFREVHEAKIRAKGTYTKDPDVNAAADWFREGYHGVAMRANRHGVKGFENPTQIDTYSPRIGDPVKVSAAVADPNVGHARVVELLDRSLRGGNAGLVQTRPELFSVAQRQGPWARGYLAIMQDTGRYTDMQRAAMFEGTGIEDMRNILEAVTENVDGVERRVMSTADVDFVIQHIQPKENQQVLTAFGMNRTNMDETVTVKKADGTDLRFTDLFHDSEPTLFSMYSSQVNASSVLTQGLAEVSRITGKEINTIPRLMAALEADLKKATDKRGRKISDKKITSTLKKIEVMIRSIRGQRLNPDASYSDFLFNLRLYNNIRMSGQFGIAQLPEFGALVGSVGWGAILRQMPTMAQAMARAADGESAPQLMRDIALIGAHGQTNKLSDVLPMMDLSGALTEFSGGKFTRLMRQGARTASVLSGMLPIHATQKKWVVLPAMQRFADIAKSGRKMGKARAGSLGMTADEANFVAKRIRELGTFEQGMFGERLVSLNPHLWNSAADNQAFNNFITAMTRWSDRVIQENDIGNMSLWMTKDWGRIVSQFRNFVLVGWEKQFLSRAAMIVDGFKGEPELAWRAWAEISQSMMVAGLAYWAQTHFNSLGMDERERRALLKRKLAPANMAAVAWQRAAVASITPDFIDSMAFFAGFEDPIFAGRTSGLPVTSARFNLEGFLSNPSISFVNDAATTAHSLIRGTTGLVTGKGEFFESQSELRKAWGLLPGARLPVMYNMANMVSEGLDIPQRKR